MAYIFLKKKKNATTKKKVFSLFFFSYRVLKLQIIVE